MTMTHVATWTDGMSNIKNFKFLCMHACMHAMHAWGGVHIIIIYQGVHALHGLLV